MVSKSKLQRGRWLNKRGFQIIKSNLSSEMFTIKGLKDMSEKRAMDSFGNKFSLFMIDSSSANLDRIRSLTSIILIAANMELSCDLQ